MDRVISEGYVKERENYGLFSLCARDMEIGFKGKANFELNLKGEQELIDEERRENKEAENHLSVNTGLWSKNGLLFQSLLFITKDLWVIADSKSLLKLLPGKLPSYVILFQYMINCNKTDNGILGS